MSKKLKVFTLKLSKWLRGGTDIYDKDGSALYNADNHRYCCLGMFGRQCGIAPRDLDGALTPTDLFDEVGKIKGDFRLLLDASGFDNGLTSKAVMVNDDTTTDDAEKIAALRPIFRKLGYRIEVVP